MNNERDSKDILRDILKGRFEEEDSLRENLKRYLDLFVSVSSKRLFTEKRRLVLFCRVLLEKPALLIIEEEALNFGYGTANNLHLLFSKLPNSTIICKASKNQNLSLFNTFLFMDGGHVIESGDPVRAMKSKQSYLYNYLKETDKETFKEFTKTIPRSKSIMHHRKDKYQLEEGLSQEEGEMFEAELQELIDFGNEPVLNLKNKLPWLNRKPMKRKALFSEMEKIFPERIRKSASEELAGPGYSRSQSFVFIEDKGSLSRLSMKSIHHPRNRSEVSVQEEEIIFDEEEPPLQLKREGDEINPELDFRHQVSSKVFFRDVNSKMSMKSRQELNSQRNIFNSSKKVSVPKSNKKEGFHPFVVNKNYDSFPGIVEFEEVEMIDRVPHIGHPSQRSLGGRSVNKRKSFILDNCEEMIEDYESLDGIF